jgi:two-component sensor histidine kinase
LKEVGAFYAPSRYLLRPDGKVRAVIATLGAAGVVAMLYFLAARLGLALLTKPSDVAVFWPASGIAAGIVIVLGRRAYPVLVVGVVVGTVAANLMSDRSLLTSLLKGFCNAGEAVLTAWLIERWFGREFAFDDLRRVLGFVAVACLGAAASALGGATTMTLFHTAAPFWDVWRAWFLSDGVGIVVVAPLAIGLGQVWREPPSQREWVEGLGVLTLLTLARLYAMGQPADSWLSFNAGITLLPPLLWLAARCPPVFAIAGAFAACMMVICATIYGIGRFGDAAVPIAERVRGAQAVVGTGTIFILVLIALFSQRKKAEERQLALIAELDHRVKNVLASVSAIIANTRQEGTSVAKFVAALDGRIRSMATTHELLSSGRWQGISVTELVRRELAPYATSNNTEISGPEVVLRPEAAQAMAMVLHELATNAAKHGALSIRNGRVAIRWDWQLNGPAHSRLVLEWQEIGGPPVVAPGEPGYGTSTIRDLIPYEFGGTVDLMLARDGVRCRLELPTDWLRESTRASGS